MTLTADLALLEPREREDRMLRVLASIACDCLVVADVVDEEDLRQLGYLAALARCRVETSDSEAAVDRFARAASAILRGTPVPTPERPLNRLHAHWGAAYGLEISKLRAELPAYLRAERRRIALSGSRPSNG